MAKIRGLREKHHQPFWDCLIRGDAGTQQWEPRPPAALASAVRLFTRGGNGNLAITNMEGSGGQFPSDQTYRVLAMRVWLCFFNCQWSPEMGGSTAIFALYHRALTQLHWDLVVAGKSQFVGPTCYLPLGGGLHGDVGNVPFPALSRRGYFNNGNPTQTSLMKLARSIALPARQNFYVQVRQHALGVAALTDSFSGALRYLLTGEVNVSFFIDGLRVRDVL